MALTEFPFETDRAKYDVILPVGNHTLELVVEDTDSLRSKPATVAVTVVHTPKPEIIKIDPDEGLRNRTLDAEIHGHNLLEASKVKVYDGSQEDDRVTVTIRSGGTAHLTPVTIEISPHAELGPRTFELFTPHGSAHGRFTVMSDVAPTIIDVTPTRGAIGLSEPIPVRIEGDSLDHASDVTFLRDGEPDPRTTARLRRPSPSFLSTDVSISANAVFGKRTLRVTTPAGQAGSPAALTFLVTPGYVQMGIILLTLMAATLRIFLMDFPNTLLIVSGLLYLVLLVAHYYPNQAMADLRRWWRLAFITYLLVVALTTYFVAIAQGWAMVDTVTLVTELLLLLLFVRESRQPV